jgi:hypothetical protein
MAMLLMLSAAASVFFRVALIAALDWFTTWLPKDSVEGVNLTWANADEPGTRRDSTRTVAAKNCLVPYFAGLELKLWK